MNKKCVIIGGPTASGKSAVAIEAARRFDGVIISADSMQIYRRMDIGTAKPSPEERESVEHKLIDILEPGENFSVAQYQKLAKAEIDSALSRNKLPFLVGGTGLYIDSVLYNTRFADIPEDGRVREELEQAFDEKGGGAMLEALREIDPEHAARLSPADRKRILRALEVYRLTGRTLSYFNSQSRLAKSDTDFLTFVLTYNDRALLYDRIDRRVDEMMKTGLLAEAEALLKEGYADSPTASQAIGYKELFGYLRGECSLSEATELLKRRSRNYAKRQITWFKRYDAQFIPMDSPDYEKRINEGIERFLDRL